MARLPVTKFMEDYRRFFRSRRAWAFVLLLAALCGMALMLYRG